MLIDNELIKNRPKQLLDIEFYTELPKLDTEFDYSSLPLFLSYDLLTLFGIKPKTMDLIRNIQQHSFQEQPSDKEIEYYQKRGTKFQIISVVANIHTFKKVNDKSAIAYPYSISLIAGQKRGLVDHCSIDLLKTFDLAEISKKQFIYTDFSPFKPVETGFYTHSSFFSGAKFKHYTDTVGFVLETYLLPTDADLNEIPMAQPQNIPQDLIEKFNKYRIKRYFRPFTDIKPRKIWGCDSPIELFLIQALAQKKLFPIIQTLIFKNGHVYDNFFEMIKSKVFIPGNELITEADLYFPKEKLAIFCDSTQFHRGKKNENKDDKINSELKNIGIKTLRLSGKDIVENLDDCVKRIIDEL
nr:hypothetical protein [uncultured Draconibacterium sp.]